MLKKITGSLINRLAGFSHQQGDAEVVYYPPFDNAQDFSDQVYRASWYLPERSGVKIRMLVAGDFELLEPEDYLMSVEKRMPANISVSVAKEISTTSIASLLEGAKFVAFWKNDPTPSIKEIMARGKIRSAMVDKNDPSRREAFEYAKFLHDVEDWAKRKERLARAKTQFSDLASKYSEFSKSYIFGTGPSLSEAYNFDFSDGLRIVCNSIVRNKQLLEHIKPHIIVAADPLFHYGCSKYAEAFRSELVDTITKYNIDFFYPFFYSSLFEYHYPGFITQSCPIPQDRMEEFNLDLSKKFLLKGIDNILTLLLLPLATTFTDEIHMLGFDGRKPEENYFWKHDTQSQYNDLMDGIKLCHPGFFDHVVYEDYYQQHCDNLESFMQQGEALGKRFNSISTTYIPALLKRSLVDKS